MKSDRSSYRWMIILMTGSQLLLSGFVAYWLRNQHLENREALKANLEDHYFRSREAVIDTLVLQHLVVPNLNDSLMISIDLREGKKLPSAPDTLEKDVQIHHFQTDSNDTRVMAFHLTATSEDSCPTLPDPDWFVDAEEEELLVRSVKLFINQSSDSMETFPRTAFLSRRFDSTLFLEQFKSSLGREDLTFTISFLGEDEKGIRVGNTYGKGTLKSGSPLIRVEGYGIFLFRKLLPQLLFALVLLGVTAWALLFAARSLRKQMALNRLRDEFIANISHELKTPVSTVKLALEALANSERSADHESKNYVESGKHPEPAHPPRSNSTEITDIDYLEMAVRETERLEKLVSKVMDHEVLRDTAASIHLESCDLNEMVKQAGMRIKAAAEKKKARIISSLPDTHVIVKANPDYLESVILNLLDNSLKYAGLTPEITVEVHSGSLGSILMVRDNGPGIPHEFKNQVFDKFFRVPTGDKHEVKGHGLGLSFVKQYMDKLGGSVDFANIPEGGCVFTLKFPPVEKEFPDIDQDQTRR